MKRPSLLTNHSGFTLLETIIAISIMLIAFTAILMVESASISTSTRSKQMNIVGMLAKNTMIKTEYDIEGRTFDEVKPEESAAFEAPYEDYRWTRTVKELKFPNIVSGSKEGDVDQATETLAKLLTQFLSKAIREVTVTISWKRAGGEQKFSVSTYWVDLNHEFQLQE